MSLKLAVMISFSRLFYPIQNLHKTRFSTRFWAGLRPVCDQKSPKPGRRHARAVSTDLFL